MMSVEHFCRMIEKDYIYFMYKANRGFPFDCHTSANIISSYLTIHFKEKFEHRTSKNAVKFHGWSKGENLCIDFTWIQYGGDELKEIFVGSRKALSKEEVYKITQKFRDEYPVTTKENLDEWHWHGKLGTEELHGIQIAQRIKAPFTIDGFMKYVKEAYEEVDKKVGHCYSVL